MNRYKCPACGGKCIKGCKEQNKQSEVDNFRFCNGMEGLECYKKTPYSE